MSIHDVYCSEKALTSFPIEEPACLNLSVASLITCHELQATIDLRNMGKHVKLQILGNIYQDSTACRRTMLTLPTLKEYQHNREYSSSNSHDDSRVTFN